MSTHLNNSNPHPHFKLLQDINALIIQGVGLEQIIQVLVEGVRDISQYKSVVFFTPDLENNAIVASHVAFDDSNFQDDDQRPKFFAPGMRVPLFAGSGYLTILETRQSMILRDTGRIIKDYTQDPKLLDSVEQLIDVIGPQLSYRIPLILENEVVGILVATRDNDGQIDEDKDLTELEYLASDVTVAINKVRMDEGLRYSEKRYRDLVQRAPDAIITIHKDGTITSVNPALTQISGYVEKELVGSSFREASFLDENEKERLRDIFEAIEDEVHMVPFEIEWIHKDGSRKYSEVHTTRILENGEVVGTQSIIRDTTFRKEAEDQLRQHREALEKQNLLLQEKNIALRELMSQLELEKQRIQEQVRDNVNQLIIPSIEKLRQRSSNIDSEYLDMINERLNELISPFAQTLGSSTYKLTSREIEICNLIRSGLSSKEIGQQLAISYRTVETMRNKIRKKLGILNSDMNLRTYLQSIQ